MRCTIVFFLLVAMVWCAGTNSTVAALEARAQQARFCWPYDLQVLVNETLAMLLPDGTELTALVLGQFFERFAAQVIATRPVCDAFAIATAPALAAAYGPLPVILPSFGDLRAFCNDELGATATAPLLAPLPSDHPLVTCMNTAMVATLTLK